MKLTVNKTYVIELDESEANDVATALRERGSQLRNGATITLSNGHVIGSRTDMHTADRLTSIADQIESEGVAY